MASQVRTGRLDNGVTYYLVKNSAEKGKAEVALVQRVGSAGEDARTAGDAAVQARGSLSDLPHFRTQTPQRYLSRSAIWPAEGGYVTVGPDATVYRFSDLTLPYSPDIVDSTLLMVFDVVGRSDAPAYAPQNQAVIVAGDIDPDALLNKMNMLSMLVTRRTGLRLEEPYAWEESDTLRVLPLPAPSGKAADLVVRYRSARTPQENMATVQSLVSWRYAREFGILLRKRLSRAFRLAGIPVSGLDVTYRSSADGPGDEQVEISLTTDPRRYISAANLLAETLAALDRSGTMEAEYRDVQNQLEMDLRREWGPDLLPNKEYVSRCISAYLYGTSLASPKSNLDFFLTRSMDPKAATDLFNSYVGALLDPRKNVTVCADPDLLPEARVRDLFNSAWSRETETQAAYVVSHSDTLTLQTPKGRVRLKSDETEPLSGGRMWTFANGIRVIYKPLPTSGVFRYTWLLKSGYGTAPGLHPGEGPYLGDMLALDNVADMKHSAFQDMLRANGITLEPTVTLTDFRLSGAAPTSRLTLLLKSLLALSERRDPDPAAYQAYRDQEALRWEKEKGSIPARLSILDSLARPSGLATSELRRRISLTDDFPQRAERFFDGAFSRMGEGVLILAGSFDENALKRILSQHLGGFRTERAPAGRFRNASRPSAGRSVRVDEGAARPQLDLEMTAYLDFTVEQYAAANIAAKVLADAAAQALSRRGWYSQASWRFDLYPVDRFCLDILSSVADPGGLPASLMPADSVETVRQDVHAALAKAASEGISAARLKAGKNELINQYNTGASDPETVISLLVLRHSYGKDLMTRYAEKVGAVSREQVDRVLKQLAGGLCAEHLVRAAQVGEPLHDSEPSEPAWPDVEPPRPAVDSTGMLDLYRELFGPQTFPLTPIL
ncbi:MAG: hypothetical protein IJ578_09135 [Bacteroidales bacterium]|nr:hypothetical protein [Bacteroidales bacterium]